MLHKLVSVLLIIAQSYYQVLHQVFRHWYFSIATNFYYAIMQKSNASDIRGLIEKIPSLR